MKCALVIPCYNFASGLPLTFARLKAWRMKDAGNEWKVIFVDDGSSDNTLEVLRRLAAEGAGWCDYIALEKNSGKGAAVREGLKKSVRDGAEIAFFTDCDLHYGLTIITERMLPELAHADVVIVDRTWDESSRHPSLRRRFASWLFSRFVGTLTGLTYLDSQAGLKGFRLSACKDIFPLLRIESFAFDVEILSIALYHRLRVHQVPVRFNQDHGFPAQSTIKLVRTSLKMFADLFRVNLNWKRGFYDSPAMHESVDRIVYTIRDE